MAAFGAAMVIINLLLAAILFSRGVAERQSDATALAAAYLFVAAIFLPLTASFPGSVMPGALIGVSDSPTWLWLFWHAGFGIAILRYARIAARPQGDSVSVWRPVITIIVTVAALTLFATSFPRFLPATAEAGHALLRSVGVLGTLAILGVATICVARLDTRSQEHMPLVVAMVAACLDVWLAYQGADRFSLGWYLAKGGSLLTSLTVLLSLLDHINTLYSQTAAASGVLASAARHDAMTGLLNRRGLDEAIGVEWRRSMREQQPLSLLLIDIDHFKRFNDHYGHVAGDDGLRRVANALQAVARRPADSAARYDGEAFALLLPATDSFGAAERATRLRAAIRGLAVPHADSPHGLLSISIGLATALAGDAGDASSLLAAAAAALYRAKEAGQDTICSADDGLPLNAAAAMPAPAWPLPAPDLDQSSQLRLPRPAGIMSTALYALHCEVLEAVASGQSLIQVTRLLCQRVERLSPGVVCSVLAVDPEGRLHPLADQSLPPAFSQAMEGVQIGPKVGACGAAAWYGHPVETHDIATDPNWQSYNALPLAAGLRACWASPIKSRNGRVIGSFAFYYRTCRAPTAFERNIVDTSLHLCVLAIEREEVWSELREVNHRLDAALSNISQGVCLFSGDTLVVANRRYSEIYGLDPASIGPGTTLDEILAMRSAAGSGPAMPLDEYRAWRSTLKAGDTRSESVVELANGRVIAVSLQPMANGESVATHDDITERRQAEAKVVYVARHDGLTGLPNRVMFDERVQQAIAMAGRGLQHAVLSADPDHFKSVNDTYGHAMGDRLLQGVAERLDACVREGDTVARLGSDEFAILLVGVDRPEGAAELAKRVIQVMSAPFYLDDAPIVVTTSIGVAIGPNDGATPGKLLQCADTALHRAKTDERSCYRFFEQDMDARLQLRFAMERDLRTALDDDEFELAYQPLFDLRENEICGFEALVRWRHPTRGLIAPNDFIPLVEETGMIVKLGAWVLQQACAEAATWPKPVRIAVNLSGIQLRGSGLVDTVKHALRASGLPATRLELEITESVLLNNSEDTLATLHALRDLGISIAMDDFGTGYSSLSYLRSFPFDKIKIDQSFIRDISDQQNSVAIISAVVGLGRSMGMTTTAEGVETQGQLLYLRREGCDEIQGYLLSQPVSAEAARAMLASDGIPAHFAVPALRAAGEGGTTIDFQAERLARSGSSANHKGGVNPL